MSFFQAEPEVTHPYHSDTELQQILNWLIADISNGEDHKNNIKNDLIRFGDDILSHIDNWGKKAEAQPPQHIPYSPWGKRIDHIEVSEEWKSLDALSAKEGLIQLGYDSNNRESGRIHQFLKLYLFHPSSAFYTCPLAMTDGAAKLIQEFLKRDLSEQVRNKLREAFSHLTTKDPGEFWTSGQWMTEKTGGSDVAISQTIARPTSDPDIFHLHGTKWFTSATTSQMCFTLARIENNKGETILGSKGLSLFYVELRNSEGDLDKMVVRRMKDKLGTKALPTAEVDFEGTTGYLVGNPGEGIKNISYLFNITRIYNAVTTIGSFRRLYQLAEDYSHKRVAFGKPLIHQPLHKKMLSGAKEQLIKCQLLTFYTVKLLQEEEKNPSEKNATLLRLFTPLAKLYTAKHNMIWTSELIESFGGAGYIEDTGLPKFLRDSQVFAIWEGTTNVLSLDCLRAIQKENALEAYLNEMESLAKNSEDKERLQNIMEWAKKNGLDGEKWQYDARDFSFELCETAIQILKPLVF